ncbi:hypothetical protein E4O93_18870 [Diaphorobacter sp. DS2]|nr:hypothetical protein E4O93_18870 [Diaphorobacter sp. DS2]
MHPLSPISPDRFPGSLLSPQSNTDSLDRIQHAQHGTWLQYRLVPREHCQEVTQKGGLRAPRGAIRTPEGATPAAGDHPMQARQESSESAILKNCSLH